MTIPLDFKDASKRIPLAKFLSSATEPGFYAVTNAVGMRLGQYSLCERKADGTVEQLTYHGVNDGVLSPEGWTQDAFFVRLPRRPRTDLVRMDWLIKTRRVAEIMVDGKKEDCWHYGIAAASGIELREAIDLAMDAEEKKE